MFTWNRSAFDERITSHVPLTTTDGIVVDDATLGVLAADTRARILALLVDASLSRLAVRIEPAFRTAGRWHSEEVRLARANWLTTHLATNAVRACSSDIKYGEFSDFIYAFIVKILLTTRRWLTRSALFLHSGFRRSGGYVTEMKQLLPNNPLYTAFKSTTFNWNDSAGL